MRILYLCHRIPYPPNKGDKIRAFHQLRAMAARHEVDVFTLADDPARSGVSEQLWQAIAIRLTVARVHPKLARLRALPYLLTAEPAYDAVFLFRRTGRRRCAKRLRQRSYDRIFVYCSAMAQYVDSVGSNSRC